MQKVLLSCGLILASSFTYVNGAKAERIVTAAVANATGIVYQVDLDNRKAYYSPQGWRHVRFWLTTRGDSRKYPAVAACSPYQVKSPSYGFDWLPNGGGLSNQTVGGLIARVACNY